MALTGATAAISALVDRANRAVEWALLFGASPRAPCGRMGDAFANPGVLRALGVEALLRDARGAAVDLMLGDSRLVGRVTSNDRDPAVPADFHLDALEFARSLPTASLRLILADTPATLDSDYETALWAAAAVALRPAGYLLAVTRHAGPVEAGLVILRRTVLQMSDGVFTATLAQRA